MSYTRYFVVVVMLSILAVACGRMMNMTKGIAVINTNFENEIEPAENLVFTFNTNIAPDSLLNTWLKVGYLEFSPPVEGAYKWTSANELVFSPLSPFPESSKFSVSLAQPLADLAGKPLQRNKPISFHTPFLVLSDAHTYWKFSGNDKSVPIAAAKLQFNTVIRPQDLASHLSVTVNGEKTAYKVLSGEPATSHDIEINIDAADENLDIQFLIAPGITPVGGNQAAEKNIQANNNLESALIMRINGVEAQHDGLVGTARVDMSQQPQADNLKRYISIIPDIPFIVEATQAGLVITSESFDVAKTYELRIDPDLTGIFGGKMQSRYTQNIVFGELKPAISFVHTQSKYLGKAGFHNTAIQIAAVPQVKVEIYKIFENNIMAFFEQGIYWGYQSDYSEGESSEDGDYEYFEYQYYEMERFGQKIYEANSYVKDMEHIGSINLLKMDFADKLAAYDGIYVVKVSDTERKFITASKIFAFSDIGIIAKQESDKIWVFLNSIQTATPISSAEVSFISNNNQRVFTATADKNGIAVFENIKEKAPDFKVAMLTAKLGNDYNYMLLNQTNVDASRFEIGGKHSNPAAYDAYIYGDRDLYRPGETIHINSIVRNKMWEKPSDEMPVKLTLLLPNGKTYKTVRKTLDEQGAIQADFELPTAAITGTYIAELYTGNDVLLQSTPISVEEFMPDRIRVNISTDKQIYAAGDSVELSGTATNLFGTPAAKRNFEAELSLRRKPFAPKNYKDYNFEVYGNPDMPVQYKEGKTGDAGEIAATFSIPEEYAYTGLLEGRIYATVFDESGRPVNRRATFEAHTQNVYLGIGNFSNYVSTRTPLTIPLAALNKAEKNITQEARLKIIRHEWRTVMESTGNGRFRYKSQREDIEEVNKLVNIQNGTATYPYTPQASGEYEVQLYLPGSSRYVRQNFYAYRFGDTQSTSFEVNREGVVDVSFDKEAYNIGDKATVLLKTPFEGKLLVTIETDRVLRHLYFDTDKKAKQFSFDVPAEYAPNIYIAATLIRPMKDLSIPLTVAHGYGGVKVDNPKAKLPVAITAVEKSRSQMEQTVTVKTEPNTSVTIAVVDEGILQIKNYQTPNPYDYFYQKRALEVDSYDIYPYLFPELTGGALLSGGDYDLGKRVNPVNNKRVKLISYWSGVQKTNASGTTSFTFSIPEFSGELRVMAVAYKNNQFGAADSRVKIADPVVISAALPRFLSPTDEVVMPVMFANTTDKLINGAVKITTEGAVSLVGSPNAQLALSPNAENRAEFRLKAASAIGEGKIKVTVNDGKENFTQTTEITVRPPASLQKRSGEGIVKGGEAANIQLTTNFIPETIKGHLVVSRSPLAEFGADLEDLIDYPHGCLEQTISKAFPQIFAYDLINALRLRYSTATGESARNPNYNVQQAIRKLEGMQLPNGGMTYWSGSDEASWWSSVYAAHFLIEARKAGFEVNSNSIDGLLKYVQKQLQKKQTFVYEYYDEAGKKIQKTIANKEIPYSLYVLALAHKPDISVMNYYKSNPKLLSLDGRYLLAAAYAVAGDKTKFQQVLPPAFEGETSTIAFDGSFYSPIRDKAIVLNSLLEADSDNPQIGRLTQQLVADFRKAGYHSTQESVFTFLALGKVAKKVNNSTVSATVVANGKTLGTAADKDLLVSYADVKNGKVELKATGNGNMYYFWELEGLTADGSYVQEDSYLKVRKAFFTRTGAPIANLNFTQNDLVVVQITIQSSGSVTVPNVAITDILPACFEIENPRITELPDMPWIKDAEVPMHQDIRDDRIHMYTTATAKPQKFYYMLRAVSPGKYVMGPVSADAMYNGEYHSYNGAGTVTVAAN